ncbi:UNVERIFIED_CONTAM: hypothetical protein FKN15_067472 [Acipenser sinensis]
MSGLAEWMIGNMSYNDKQGGHVFAILYSLLLSSKVHSGAVHWSVQNSRFHWPAF